MGTRQEATRSLFAHRCLFVLLAELCNSELVTLGKDSTGKFLQEMNNSEFYEWLNSDAFNICKKALTDLPQTNVTAELSTQQWLVHGRLTYFGKNGTYDIKNDPDGWEGTPRWFFFGPDAYRQAAYYAGAGHIGYLYHPNFAQDKGFVQGSEGTQNGSPRILTFQPESGMCRDGEPCLLKLETEHLKDQFEEELINKCEYYPAELISSTRLGIDRYDQAIDKNYKNGFRNRLLPLLKQVGFRGAKDGAHQIMLLNPTKKDIKWTYNIRGKYVWKQRYNGKDVPIYRYSFLDKDQSGHPSRETLW